MFACKNNVVDSALDGVGMGIGYTLTVVLMATIREVLGSYGVLMAGCVWLEGKLDARIQRKSCCDIDNLKKEG